MVGRSIPEHVYSMALIIKRFTRPGMEENWQDHFSVDIVNGSPGHELKIRRAGLGGHLSAGRFGRFSLANV